MVPRRRKQRLWERNYSVEGLENLPNLKAGQRHHSFSFLDSTLSSTALLGVISFVDIEAIDGGRKDLFAFSFVA
jgi:hypothetical protein